MCSSPSNRPPQVIAAMQWATQVTSVSLTMALPALFGLWLDGKWGTKPWLLIVGAVLGLLAGLRSLVRMADLSGANRRPDRKSTGGESDREVGNE